MRIHFFFFFSNWLCYWPGKVFTASPDYLINCNLLILVPNKAIAILLEGPPTFPSPLPLHSLLSLLSIVLHSRKLCDKISDNQEAKSLAFKICVFPLMSVSCAHTYLLTGTQGWVYSSPLLEIHTGFCLFVWQFLCHQSCSY